MMKKLAMGLALGVGASMLAASAVKLGNRRVDEWETATQDDAPDGKFVTLSNGAHMRFVECGFEGEPLILIHGLMDSADFWHHNIEVLAREHHVFAIDMIGFGYSSRVDVPVYSPRYLARAVREFMDVLSIKRASVIGHSLGGAVTLELARACPERVSKLILIAPGTFLVNRVGFINLFARVPHAPRAVLGLAMTSARARMRAYRHALGNPANVNLEDALMRVRPMRVKGTADALVAMASSNWSSSLEDELGRITAPTLILWGDRDRAVPVAHAEHHVCALPNAELVILEGAGHIPHIEYPERVNPLLRDFLARQDAIG